MSDLVVRLRNYIPGENQDWVAIRISEAADEIERLTARLATIEQETVERCAKICDQIAINAERRMADYTQQDAIAAAYDKMTTAEECADRIRRASALTSPDEAGK